MEDAIDLNEVKSSSELKKEELVEESSEMEVVVDSCEFGNNVAGAGADAGRKRLRELSKKSLESSLGSFEDKDWMDSWNEKQDRKG